jgi:acetoin utilization deacetylase AcuC-like enzyme
MKKIPVLYDPIHRLHAPQFEYDRGVRQPYQEVPGRAISVEKAMLELDWVKLVPPLPESAMDVEELYAIHDPALVSHIQEASRQVYLHEQEHPNNAPIYNYPWIFPIRPVLLKGLLHSAEPSGCFAFDTYSPIGSGTWQAALSSAWLAWQGAGLVLEGEKLAYAICRPPGHHAGVDRMGGYCYLNNAALAASRFSSIGQGAILDIDYHHGNGTQEIFWNNSRVLYVSIHADPQEEYPFFSGFADELGGEDAFGTNLNIPLPMKCDDTTYLEAMDIAIQKIKNFHPKWLVLSAGFDTCADDPSTNFSLSEAVYQEIGSRVGNLHLPTLVVHEGGYAVEKNGELAAKLLYGLLAKQSE